MFTLNICFSIFKCQINTRFELIYKDSLFNREIIQKCPSIMKGHFRPNFFLFGGNLQTIFAPLSGKKYENEIQFNMEVVRLKDGGEINLDWACLNLNKRIQNKNSLVVICPGLTSTSSDKYIRNQVYECLIRGYKVVIYQDRFISTRTILPTNKYMDLVEDLKEALEIIQARHPDFKIFSIGFSYGANRLMNYLGKEGSNSIIKGGVSLANPFDFLKASRTLGIIYSVALCKFVKKFIKKQLSTIEFPDFLRIDQELIQKTLNSQFIYDIDEFFISKILGYKNADDYYVGISCDKVISNVCVPTLCIQSQDDPFFDQQCIPIQKIKNNQNIILLLTQQGGHIGWVENFTLQNTWFQHPAIQFIDSINQ